MLLVGSVRDDAECVDAAAHQRCDRGVGHAVPLELRTTREGWRHQRHPEMAALPGARVARMMGAVIDHLDGNRRKRLLEGGANLAGA